MYARIRPKICVKNFGIIREIAILDQKCRFQTTKMINYHKKFLSAYFHVKISWFHNENFYQSWEHLRIGSGIVRRDFFRTRFMTEKMFEISKNLRKKILQLRSLKSLSRTSSGYTCQINIRLRRHLTRSLKHVKTDISPPKTGSKSASLWFWSFYRRVLNCHLVSKNYSLSYRSSFWVITVKLWILIQKSRCQRDNPIKTVK